MNLRFWLKKMMSILMGAFSFQLCCACGVVGHGFDREEIRSQLALQMPTITDDDIKKASLAKSDLGSAFSVGTFYRESVERDLTNTRVSQWSGLDRKKISESLQKLKEKTIISDYSTLNPLLVPGRDLKSLLLAAAHSHVDTLLLISGIGAVDAYDNPWAVTYLPIFTMFFVRGTNVDALFKIKAELWDVKNQYLFFAIDFENIQREKRPGWLRYEQLILEKAKAQAIEKLKVELYNKFAMVNKKLPQGSDTWAPVTNFSNSQLISDK